MFPGCYYAQSLIVTDRAIYRREPLPFPIGFTDQVRESDVAYILRKYGGTYVWLYRGDRLFCHRLFFVVDHSAVGDPCSTINFSYVEAY